MIQTVPFYIPPVKTKRLNRLQNIIYVSIGVYGLRVIVLENLLFIPSFSTLVRFGIEELCQLKNNNYYDEKKKQFGSLWHGRFIFIYLYFVFIEVTFNILVPKLLNLIENLQIYGHICNFTMCHNAMCYISPGVVNGLQSIFIYLHLTIDAIWFCSRISISLYDQVKPFGV